MDLGVARLQDEAIRLSQTGAFVGSVQYAAPEQFGKRGTVDHRVDLHALGLMLYELACGQQPYYEEDFRVALQKLLNDEPRRVSEINPQLSPFYEEVVHTLIAKSQDDRFQTAGELIAILEEGEDSDWWEERRKALRIETKQPLRRIRIVRETALYGRDQELAKLGALFEEAKAGEGRVLLIEGEAGIGKTRLVDEFVGQRQQAGEDLNFLFGSYPPGGVAAAGGAFSTAFREHLGPDGSAPYLTETPLLAPAFDALLRGDATPTGAEPLTKESIGTCFVHATRALAAERPTVLLIDDLQFAPEDARNLFSAIALAVPGHRVLLVGTLRPGVPEDWHANLTRLEHAQQLALPRLGPKDLVHVLQDTFRSERLATELGLQIALKSDGNPYYVFEIVRGLREGRYITQSDDGTWVRTQVIDRIQIPSSVMDLIQARIGDLTEEEKDLLDVAACCGYEFDPGLVAAALDMKRIPALKRFGAIEKKHRLIRSAGRHMVFDHYQVQEALYEGVLQQLREEYHSALAETLEEREDAAETEPNELDGPVCLALCNHYLRGQRGKRALRYLEPALDYLEAGYLNDDVLRLADLALGARGVVKGEARVKLLLRKAARLGVLGRRDEQRAALDEALPLAEALDEPLAATRVMAAIGAHLSAGARYEEAQTVYSQVLERAREAGDRGLEGLAESGIGNMLLELGRNEAARERLQRAHRLAREAEDQVSECRALGRLGDLAFHLGQYEDAQRQFERHAAHARELGDKSIEANAALRLGNVAWARGRTEDERTSIERYRVLSREIGSRSSEALALHNLGDMWVLVGRHDRARECLEGVLVLIRETGAKRLEAGTMAQLARVAELEGDTTEAERLLEEAAAVYDSSGVRSGHTADAILFRGDLVLRAGQSDEARHRFEEALEIAEAASSASEAVRARCWLALLPGGDSRAALGAFMAERERLAHTAAMESRFLLWKATDDPTHLAEAHRLLVHLRDHAPEEARTSVIENVPLHRDIWAAAQEAGL
jgi:tetratricopeptide (TPR) repeat protein